MKRGVLPLNALRAFESAARLGRMGDAAEELGVTHSAISRQVRGLEGVLGVPLFEGARNRLELSDVARDLLPALTAAFDGIADAVSRITEPERRPLDVSCLGTLTMRWLIPRLFAFQDAHPAIDIRLTSDDGPVDFGRERIDVAVRVGHGGWPEDAKVTPLFDDRAGPVLSPSLRAADQISDWRDLVGCPLLHTKTRLDAWTDWCASAGATLDLEGRRFEHFYFMLEAATAGLGVAIAPEVLVQDDIAAGRLIAPFGFVPNGQTYVALSRPTLGRDGTAFLAWLEAQAAEQSSRSG